VVNIRNKIVAVATLFAVMIAITGIAAAQNEIRVEPGVITIDAGGTATQEVTVTAEDGNITSLKVSGVGFKITDKFDVFIDGEERTSISGDFTSPKTFTVTLVNGKGGSDEDLTINYAAKFTHGDPITKKAKIQNDIKIRPTPTPTPVVTPTPTPPVSVPEFPTVALPIAAIMGLVFLFQYRKGRNS